MIRTQQMERILSRASSSSMSLLLLIMRLFIIYVFLVVVINPTNVIAADIDTTTTKNTTPNNNNNNNKNLYKLPKFIGHIVKQLQEQQKESSSTFKFLSALDVGCDVGLIGRHIRQYVSDNQLICIEPSQLMVETITSKCTLNEGCGLPLYNEKNNQNKQKQKQPLLYDRFIVDNLQNELIIMENNRPKYFGLITVSDMYVTKYGLLSNLFQNLSKLSNMNGILIFSCERYLHPKSNDNNNDDDGYKLEGEDNDDQRRYVHTKNYILKEANNVGYELLSYNEIITRTDHKGKEIPGHLFTFFYDPK